MRALGEGKGGGGGLRVWGVGKSGDKQERVWCRGRPNSLQGAGGQVPPSALVCALPGRPTPNSQLPTPNSGSAIAA